MEFSRPDYWKWVAFPFRGSSQPRVQTQLSHIAGRFFTSWATREAKHTRVCSLSLLQYPGIKPGFPALQADSLPAELSEKLLEKIKYNIYILKSTDKKCKSQEEISFYFLIQIIYYICKMFEINRGGFRINKILQVGFELLLEE